MVWAVKKPLRASAGEAEQLNPIPELFQIKTSVWGNYGEPGSCPGHAVIVKAFSVYSLGLISTQGGGPS